MVIYRIDLGNLAEITWELVTRTEPGDGRQIQRKELRIVLSNIW